jgi:tetratricopeptide (TPR) repeat protein
MNERALAEYETSLRLEPSDVVHNNIAVIHMAAARWPEAERELYAELALNPRYAKAYFNLGIVLRREGRLVEAIAAEERALELDPGEPGAARELARDRATLVDGAPRKLPSPER